MHLIPMRSRSSHISFTSPVVMCAHALCCSGSLKVRSAFHTAELDLKPLPKTNVICQCRAHKLQLNSKFDGKRASLSFGAPSTPLRLACSHYKKQY